MTRRKDKIRQKKKAIQKKRDLGKSRLFLQQEEKKKEEEEKKKEIQFLEKVKKMPTELIRIIFSYMSGKAKLVCNYKFDYLDRHGAYILENFINDLQKKDILDLIHKGILHKYPDIIEKFQEHFYCRDIQEFTNVQGQRLIQLWETDNLIYDIYGYISSVEENTVKIDRWTKHTISESIGRYICDTRELYRLERNKTITHKPDTISGNTLFLDLDKVFYLYRCLEKYMLLKGKYPFTANPLLEHSIPLIPVPLHF
jgi:hypothetical protein